MFEILKWFNICAIPKYLNDGNTCSDSLWKLFCHGKIWTKFSYFYEEDKIYNAL